ncbi:MAG: choline ABC transporter ATP-binding protein [Parvibaculaceae bacterium]
MSEPAVSFRHVDIIFGERAAEGLKLLDQGATRADILSKCGAILGVADASLDVGEGEITVLMGLSGSGKSTLMRAVNGLNKPIRGSVMVRDGEKSVDVAKCDPETLRRIRMGKVAMVFQQFALLPWRTVEENAGFGLELAGVPEAERKARVQKQLDLVGLSAWGKKYAQELSGGMQQRVGLARAFATEAPILLMDEPFSALDPLIRTKLQDELLALQRQLRRTIVFVSHDLDEALKIGTRIAIMESGRIVQHGVPQDIVLKPANDYVAEFVAHMNPLNVLTGATMMSPTAKLRRNGEALLIDDIRDLRLGLSPAGGIQSATLGGRPLSVTEGAEGRHPHGTLAAMAPSTSMRKIIDARRQTGLPVALVEDGRLIGIVGDEEIYNGILHRSASS